MNPDDLRYLSAVRLPPLPFHTDRLFLSPTSSLPRFSLEHARGVGRALAHGSLAAGIRFGGFALARIAIQESMPTGENRTLKVAQTGLAGGVGGALEGALLGVRCKRLETLSRQGVSPICHACEHSLVFSRLKHDFLLAQGVGWASASPSTPLV